MRAFWDERARENAYFFVDHRLAYRNPDLDYFWGLGEQDLERILTLLDARIRPSDVIVDIGCGVGRLTRPIAARAARVYGIDISSEMLERARRHHAALRNVEWMLGDGKTLRPVADTSVDGCISHVVFQHIPDPQVTFGYVREMGRVLRPGGWAAFQVSNSAVAHRRPLGLLASVNWLRATTGRGPRGRADPAWLGSAIDLEQLREAAREAGLTLEKIVGEGKLMCMVLATRRSERERNARVVQAAGERRTAPVTQAPGERSNTSRADCATGT